MIDIHTHLTKDITIDLVETLNNHYLVNEYICTHLKSKASRDDFLNLSLVERSQEIWNKMFIENKPISREARAISKCIDSFGCNEYKNSIYDLTVFINNNKDLIYKIFSKKIFNEFNIKKIFMSNYALDGYSSDDIFTRVLRTDRRIHDYVNTSQRSSYGVNNLTPQMISIATITNTEDTFDLFDIDGLRYVFKNLNYDTDTKKIPIHIFFGADRYINKKIKIYHQDLGEGIPVECSTKNLKQLLRLIRAFDDRPIFLSNMIESLEMEFISIAKNYPNVILCGFWWYMSSPELIKKYLKIRIQELGYNFVPFFSDAKSLFQMYYRWAEFEKIFETVLSEEGIMLFRDTSKPGHSLPAPMSFAEKMNLFMKHSVGDIFDGG